MSEVIQILCAQLLIYLPEMVAMLLLGCGILAKKCRLDTDLVLFCVIGELAYLARTLEIVPRNTNIGCFIYVLYLAYCWRKTMNLKKAIQMMTATFVILFAEELLVMFVIEVILHIIPVSVPWGTFGVNVLGSVFTALISYILYHKNYLVPLVALVFERNRILGNIIVATGAVCMLGAMWFQLNKSFTDIEALMFCSFMFLLILTLEQWKKETELGMEKDRRIRLQQMCQESYEQLLVEVRNRQHEFQNHLTALQGMCYSCQSLEELTQVQSRYCDRILAENKYNKLLYGTSSPIIGGFLYSKFSKAEEKGITTIYRISLQKESMDAFDLIEMLGVLYDNAAEEVEKQQDKRIDVRILEETDQMMISVGNRSPYIEAVQIASFFQQGVSTKGTGRGLGLTKLQAQVTMCGGKIITENTKKEDGNWFVIKMIIPLPYKVS